MALDPTRTGTMYAGTSAGILKTSDGGGTWLPANKGLLAAAIWKLKTDPSEPSRIYAATDIGVWVGERNGTEWSARNPSVGGWFNKLAVGGPNPATLYATGFNSEGVLKSTDAGLSWLEVTDAELVPGVSVFDLAVDPQDGNIVYASARGPSIKGVYKSTDGGSHWAKTLSHWFGPIEQGAGRLTVDPTTPGTVYASCFFPQGIFYKTTDGGTSWTQYLNPTEEFAINCGILLVDASRPSTLYAAGNTGLSKSLDGGSTWISCVLPRRGDVVVALAADPNNSSILYAAMFLSGIYVSTDGGDTWVPDPGVGLTNAWIFDLVVGGSGLPPAPSGGLATFLDAVGLGSFARSGLRGSFWKTGRAIAAPEPGRVLLFGGAQPDGGAAGVFRKDITGAVCGNQVVESGEQCDDGNLVDGDGCDSNCTVTGCGKWGRDGRRAVRRWERRQRRRLCRYLPNRGGLGLLEPRPAVHGNLW